jgi:hypothetical protein
LEAWFWGAVSVLATQYYYLVFIIPDLTVHSRHIVKPFEFNFTPALLTQVKHPTISKHIFPFISLDFSLLNFLARIDLHGFSPRQKHKPVTDIRNGMV